MKAFTGPFRIIDDTELPAQDRLHPDVHAQWVRTQLSDLRLGDPTILHVRRPRPTAAFSPQDTTNRHYLRATEQARARGFVPVERGTGGRLTMFDENALGITIVAPQAAPQGRTMERFVILSSAIADGLKSLGIDARVGELPNEYCPGRFSINADGRIKLVGVAQRMNQRCVQMGAVISVIRSDSACAGIAEAYDTMGLTFNPDTYGAISELLPSVSYADVRTAIMKSITAAIVEA
jgi:octanoyl-[GcvH]:protein N-octanoyltransferase